MSISARDVDGMRRECGGRDGSREVGTVEDGMGNCGRLRAARAGLYKRVVMLVAGSRFRCGDRDGNRLPSSWAGGVGSPDRDTHSVAALWTLALFGSSHPVLPDSPGPPFRPPQLVTSHLFSTWADHYPRTHPTSTSHSPLIHPRPLTYLSPGRKLSNKVYSSPSRRTIVQ